MLDYAALYAEIDRHFLSPESTSRLELLAGYARQVAPISIREGSSVAAYPEAAYVCKLSLEGGF